MNKNEAKAECPNCGHEIDVNKLLYDQLNEKLTKKYNDDLAKEQRKFEEQSSALEKKRVKPDFRRSALSQSTSQLSPMRAQTGSIGD